MPPMLALALYLVCLAALLRYDPCKDETVSRAIWIPLLWMLIIGSRLPSQWLNLGSTSGFEAYQEGSLLDRTVFLSLMIAAVWVLRQRSVQLGELLSGNWALTLFLAYAAVSFLWSDYHFISLKRWVRDLGLYLVILVALTEKYPLNAFHLLLRRLTYCLIPLSVVLIKYFPEIGKGFSEWTGHAYFLGVTTSKNMLGNLCLVGGLFLFWDLSRRWSQRKEKEQRRVIWLNVAFLAMTLWLMNLADSATSEVSLLIGVSIVLFVHREKVLRNPRKVRILIPASICLVVVAEGLFGVSATVTQALGRDATLTGRTELWEDVLRIAPNGLLGAGYESFWLGDRLKALWAIHPWRPNQAHNGYLEVYLNLGLAGLGLLFLFLFTAYHKIGRRLLYDPHLASFGLAMWCILLIYNITEAAFKSHLVWFVFVLGAISIPRQAADPASDQVSSRRDDDGTLPAPEPYSKERWAPIREMR